MAHLTFQLIRLSLWRLRLDFRFLLLTPLISTHLSNDVAVELRHVGTASQLICKNINSTVSAGFGIAPQICFSVDYQRRLLFSIIRSFVDK